MLKIYDEPEALKEGARLRSILEPNERVYLRSMMNRGRQMGGGGVACLRQMKNRNRQMGGGVFMNRDPN